MMVWGTLLVDHERCCENGEWWMVEFGYVFLLVFVVYAL